MESKHFFHTELSRGLFQISDPQHGPNEDGKSLLPGKATRNSYLVIGSDCAILFDLALEDKGLRRYAESLSSVPVITVLSHAHIDHIYHIGSEREVWLGRADETLLRKGAFPIQPPVLRCPVLHFLDGGDALDLGDRVLDVINIPGHTNGSILLYDRKSRILLSGDTCARRLLYGMHGNTPTDEFCDNLEKLKNFDIDRIYSAHDRCPLGIEHIDLMTSVIRGQMPVTKSEAVIPVIGKMTTFEYGNEEDVEYFSFAYRIQ